MIGLPIIDAHQHFWNYKAGSYAWLTDEYSAIRRDFSPADLQPALTSHGVVGTVAVQTRADTAETRELLALSVDSAFIVGVVGWVDLTRDDVADQIRTLKRSLGGDHLVGVRHNAADETDQAWLLRSDVLRGLKAVSDAGLTFDLEVKPSNLQAAAALAAARPELRLVLDHLGKPAIGRGRDRSWEASLRHLAAQPNVWAKVSGLVTEARWQSWTTDEFVPFVRTALEAFGVRRLIFGSDWPVCLVAATYGRVLGAARTLFGDLNASAQRSIFAGNAVEAYRLDVATTVSAFRSELG